MNNPNRNTKAVLIRFEPSYDERLRAIAKRLNCDLKEVLQMGIDALEKKEFTT